ncbi:hypothetical protein ACHAXM_002634, partial [Skeletonema potamos]
SSYGSSSSGSESGDSAEAASSSSSSSQVVIASGNSSLDSSGGSSLKQKQQRQRGSYASATASSKARGGPTSSAPPAKPASTMKTAIRPLPKMTTDKENETTNPSAAASSSTFAGDIGTPVKPPAAASAATENAVILSPTPYYKVLEERGGKTSPRLTRSAAKRAQTKRAMDSLAQLDNIDDDSDVETPLPNGAHHSENVAAANNDGFDSARIALQFQPPDRYEWQPRQQSKIRKSIQPSGGSSRNVKRTKYNNNTTNHEQMNADQVRQIMTETLQNFSSQNNNEDKLLSLSAEAASARKELEVTKSQLEQMTTKYNALEECMKVKECGERELRERLLHCQKETEDSKRQLEAVQGEKQRLERQIELDGGEWTVERQRMKNEHDDQMQQKEMELQKAKEAQYELSVQSKCTVSELEVVKAKLQEAVSCHEKEMEMIRESANGSKSDWMERVAKLEREKAELNEVNCANEQEVKRLREELDMTKSEYDVRLNEIQNKNDDMIAQKDELIQQLRSDLDDAEYRLDDANRTMEVMQSPKSREAMESEYSREVEVLRNEMKGMKQLLRQMNETNEDLQQKLGQSKDENDVLVMQIQGLEVKIVEAKAPAAELESENTMIVEQLSDRTRELKASQQQLEELAVENEQVLAKLDEKESELRRTVGQMEMQSKQLVDVESKMDSIMSEKESLLSENESLATELNHVQDHVSHLQSQVESLTNNLVASQRQAELLCHHKIESDQKLNELSHQLQSLTTHLEAAQGTISSLEDKLHAKNKYCEQFENIEKKLICEKNVLNEIRRVLHNKVIQLTGNIRVYIRVRPLISSEHQLTLARPSSASGRPSSRGSISSSSQQQQQQQQQQQPEECFHFPGLADRKMGATKSPNYTSFSDLSKQTIELTEPQRDRGGLNPRRKKWKYGFDKVFNPVNDQADVWEGAEPLVQSAVDGHKVCMFAYGQTSSGKTHTMIGDSVNRGIIPRAVEKLFASKKEIEQSFQGDVSVSIKVELLEIYNEEVYDLLNAEAGPKGQKIKIKLNSNEAVNNAVVEASTQDEVQGVLQLAQQRRCVKATKSNAESSRSHLLFTVRFELSSLINEEMNRQGVLHIVDLAGSERLDKSGSQGTLLTEAKHINTSLSALSHVIQKLQEKSDHIPYRDSKLTYLLRDSLGGDSKTLCIVCCSPHQAHFNESLNSIRFAANASKVELKQGNKVDV